jgi:hypothetical protein
MEPGTLVDVSSATRGTFANANSENFGHQKFAVNKKNNMVTHQATLFPTAQMWLLILAHNTLTYHDLDLDLGNNTLIQWSSKNDADFPIPA